MDDSRIEIYYLTDMPGGLRWVWMDADLLVIEAHLDGPGRRAAIEEAFADARTRALAALDAA